MYFELKAANVRQYKMALWDADVQGLDPYEMESLTFNVGTGSIEKVSRLRDKHNLALVCEKDFMPTGYLGRI